MHSHLEGSAVIAEAPADIRVVIADDDPDIRSLMAIAVRKAGFTLVAEAADGTSALDRVTELSPDLVVLDVSMPGRTGLEVASAIRADAALVGTRIAILSAGVGELAVQAGVGAGADAYLTKPFSPRDLASKLAEIMQ